MRKICRTRRKSFTTPDGNYRKCCNSYFPIWTANNIEGYEEIFNRLEGADEAIFILKQTADEISAQVRKGAGQISIDYLNLSNNYGFITLGRGSAGTSSTRGILMCGPPISGSPDEYRNHFYASNAAARMTGEDMFGGESLYTYADGIDATTSISVTSDERTKNDISYDLAERYGAFYRALKPARYHMNDSRSDRTHTGFIAQQMKDALTESGLDSQALAALVQKDHNAETEDGGNGYYSIRYSELIALNTAMVQTLLARVDALENKLIQTPPAGTSETEGDTPTE